MKKDLFKKLTCLFVILIFLFSSCKNSEKKHLKDRLTQRKSETEITISNYASLAAPITYDVVIKNPNPEDDWIESCLEKLDREKLVNIIFDAVLNEKVTAMDYLTDKPMTVKEIRELEEDEEFDRSRVAKIQFIEDWYFDKESFTMKKIVHSVMLGYEVYDWDGNVRGHKAAFKVNLKTGD
ncbi:hypothetical protein ES708_06240 [subsurface metagenome]